MKEYIENLKRELEEKEKLVDKLMRKYEEEVAELEVLKKMGATIDEKEATLKIELEGVPLYIKPNPLKVYELLKRVEKEIESTKESISALESIAQKLADLPGFAVIVEMKDGKVVAAYMDRIASFEELGRG